MKKTLNTVGVLVGIVVMILGVYILFTPAEHFYTDSAKSYKFGADYYTEQYEATRIAAQNTAVTANNIREIGNKLAQYAGFAFIAAGAIITIEYLKKMNEKDEVVVMQAAPALQAVEEKPAEELPEL